MARLRSEVEVRDDRFWPKRVKTTACKAVVFTFTRALGSRLNTPQTSITNFGSNYTDQGPPALPEITVSGYFTHGEQFAGPKAGDDFYSVRDMVTSTKGKHNLQYGVEISLDKDAIVADEESWGSFTFAASAPNSTQNALADLLTGTVNNLTEETPYTTLETSWYYGFFLQDNYRVNPHLTLNLGLRYDLTTPWVDSRNQEQTFVPGVQSTVVPAAPLGLLYPGDKGVTRGIVDMRKHHISPRLGFAWDPFGDGKTAIRAGAGVFYGSPTGDEWNQGATGQPFGVDQTYSSIASLTNPYGNPASFPNGDPFPYSFNPSNAQFFAGCWRVRYRRKLPMASDLSTERSCRTAVAWKCKYYSRLRGHTVPRYSFRRGRELSGICPGRFVYTVEYQQ